MIKKRTKAVFDNGDYAGEYDWQGGVPLSEGEILEVDVNGQFLKYELYEKSVRMHQDEVVEIVYKFKMSA